MEVGLSLFNYQDDARSNKHKTTYSLLKKEMCLFALCNEVTFLCLGLAAILKSISEI